MSRRTVTCVEWTCDDCGEKYDDGEGGAFHLTATETPSGWEAIDGKDVCDACVDKRQCLANGGHQWDEWDNGWKHRYRYCKCCTAYELAALIDGGDPA